MEKVKLTKEQAEAIEHALQEVDEYKGNPDKLLRHASMKNVYFRNELHLLNSIDTVNLAKALYIGYEVEPKFEAGDWVVWDDMKIIGQLVEIGIGLRVDAIEYDFPQDISLKFLRHATPEEIQQEKERRFWNKFGREVNEYRAGDIVKGRGVITEKWRLGPVKKTPELEGAVQIEDISDGNTIDLEMESCRLICPVENRLDREGE